MKIIDNRKDFYDFLAGYDSDDSINYIRTTNSYSEHSNKSLLDNVLKSLKSSFPIIPKQPPYFSSNKYDYYVHIDHIFVGIYPFVYIAPIVVIYDTCDNKFSRITNNAITIPISPKIYSDIDAIKNLIFEKCPNIKNTNIKYCINYKSIKYHYSHNFFVDVFKVENKDIFENIIKAPTFVYLPNDRHYSSLNIKILNNFLSHDRLIVNPVFTSFKFNFIKGIMDDIMEEPVYNNIENFLWAVKQEPISEPDNKTKIINHGFDVKTSFRKM